MKREVALDSWRGLMLVVMAAYHFGGSLGAGLRHLLGYVSAAEGFVFLSGVMCGLVYSRYGQISDRLLRERAWRRAWTIYCYHVGVLLTLLAFVVLLSLSEPRLAGYYEQSSLSLFLEHPAASLATVLLCLYLPEMTGILGLYIVYMALAPFVITQFLRGRVLPVFAASLAAWLFAQFGGSTWLAGLLPGRAYMSLGTFDVFAWQILFVAGSYIGVRRANGQALLPELGPGVFWGALVLAVALCLARHVIYEPERAAVIPEMWSATTPLRLGWLRVVNTAIIAFLVYELARRYKVVLDSRWLALLGRHSLQVFAFHALAVYVTLPVLWRVFQFGPAVDALATALLVASLGVPALLHERYRLVQRRAG